MPQCLMSCLTKDSTCNGRDSGVIGSIPGPEDPLEEGTATHCSILAWRIPWTEEPGGLQSMGSQRDTTEVNEHAPSAIRRGD